MGMPTQQSEKFQADRKWVHEFCKRLYKYRYIRMSKQLLHDLAVPTEKATFCMGCYWAPECTFGVLAGVVLTRVGHAGSEPGAPCSECHEAIEIDFDPTVITYRQLLDVFWLHHDPTELTPVEYQSVILYHKEEQRIEAERSCAEMKRQRTLLDDKPVLTKVLPARVFYDAEEKNQKYRLQQHPWLMEAIGLTGVPSSGDSAPSLKTSHVAARLNGYVVGAGGAAQFEREVASLGLSEPAVQYVGKLLRKNPRPANCGTGGCDIYKSSNGNTGGQ